MADAYDIASMQEAVEEAFRDTADLWGLTYNASGDYYDLPNVPVAQGVRCDIVAIESIQEPTVYERVQSLGMDPRQYRLVQMPARIAVQFPAIKQNWQIRQNVGAANERRYVVKRDPALDQSQLVVLELDCEVVPKPWGD